MLKNRNSREKGKEKVPVFKLSSDIKQRTDMGKVFEEQILDSWVECSLWELLVIAKIEPRSSRRSRQEQATIDGVKWSEGECERYLDDRLRSGGRDFGLPLHKPALGTCDCRDLVWIDNVRESVVARIDHGSKINLRSKEFYRKEE